MPWLSARDTQEPLLIQHNPHHTLYKAGREMTDQELNAMWSDIQNFMNKITDAETTAAFRTRLHPQETQDQELKALREYQQALWNTVKFYYWENREELSAYVSKYSKPGTPLSEVQKLLERVLDNEIDSALLGTQGVHSE